MEIEDAVKIIAFILAIIGAIALIFGIPSLITTDPNPVTVIGGAVALAIGVFLFKTFG